MKSLYLFLVWAYCVQQVLCLAKPRIVCPLYVPENKSTTCWCENPKEGQGQVRLWWPLRSNTSQLLLKNVQREDNGTQSNCSMTIDGQTTSSVYTLRVAYGPSSEHLHVSPLQFVSCRPQTFSVTCNAMETYPTPAYNWSGIACENTAPDNICTFPLDPKRKYFKIVTCNATGQLRTTQKLKASKTFRLDFYCPPLHKPVIQPAPTNHVLRPGDNVTCTVTGGRPPVESVHFYCVNPFLADEDDERNETSVSSSVTVNSSLVSVKNMECYCNATWKEGPEYYQYVSTAVYNGEVTPDKDYAYYPLGMVAGVFALPFFATFIALFIAIRKRLHYRRRLTNNPNTGNPRNDRISFAGPERVSLLASDPPDGHVPCSSTLPTSDNSRNATPELPTASSDTESVQMDVHPSETSPSRRQSQPSLAATEEVLDTDVVYGNIPKEVHPPQKPSPCSEDSEQPSAGEELDTDAVYSTISKATGSGTQRRLLSATAEGLDTDAVYGNIPKEVHPPQKPSPHREESEQPLASEDLNTDAVYSTISKATGSGTQRSLLANTAEGLDTDAVYGNIPKEVHPPQKPSPCRKETEQPSAGEELDTDAVYSTISKATGSGTQRRLFSATAEGLDTDAVHGNIPKEVHPPQKPSPHREESEQPLASEDLNTDAVYSTISKATGSGTQRRLLANTAEGLDTDAVYGNIPKEVHPPQKPSPCREETEQPFAGEEQDTDAVYSTISKATGSGTQRSLLANTAEALDTDAVYGNIPKEVHPPQKPSPCREETEQPFAGEEQDTDAVYSTISNDTGSETQRSLLVGERSESEGSRLGEDRGEDHKEHAELSDESTTAASASCLETKAEEQAADEEEVYNALSYARHNTLSASDVYDRICFDQANNKQENTPRRKSHE